MTSGISEFRKAGFWLRFTAIWIDSAVVVGLAYLIVVSAQALSMYIPFELLALGLAVVYSTLLIGARGQTIGKTICGLRVLKNDGTPLNYLTSLLRECIAKPAVAILFPAGLVVIMVLVLGPPNQGLLFIVLPSIILLFVYVIHFALTKRTWYDYLARTIVQQNLARKKRGALALLLVLSISGFFAVRQSIQYLGYYRLYNDMLAHSTAKTAYNDRDPQRLVDISSLAPSSDSLFVRWLDGNGKTPIDYAVQMASTHLVVVFGEAHGVSSQISFLSEAIPELYHRAGVRCIAMEVCTHEDNEEIARLVTAPEYDHDLALRIARNQPWRLWGAKEYWDVLYAVWQLNRSLPESEKRMRVIGIDSQWDGPSFALAFGGGADAVKGPVWEKLRIMRALLGSLDLLLRDELMAREVERQILNTGERGIVWCGANHSFINYKQPYGKGRMAYMLRHKYGDRVFQILLDIKDTSPTVVDPSYSGPPPRMGDLIERIMAQRAGSPTGFSVAGSPFEFLRDSTHYHYSKQPNTAFGDVASGYIFLEPRKEFKGCQWLNGFITPRMFATYKPFYEGRANRPFSTVGQANEFFKKKTESNQ